MVLERLKRPKGRENGANAAPYASPDFLEALGVAVYTTDANGIITSFNDAAFQLWGRKPELGKDQWCGSWKIYRTDGTPLPHDQCPMGVCLKEDRIVRGEEAIAERPDGTRVWFVPYPTPLHDAEGNLIGAVNVLVDVTERRRAEEVASYFNAIVASSDDAIVSKDLNGTITSWNDGAERLFGFKADEVIGHSIYVIIPADRRDEEHSVLTRVRRGERVEHFETLRRTKDGTHVPISLTVSPVRDRDGRIIGASKVARDISERKRWEAAVAEALAIKDEFISLVSHELRTPLTTILGNAAILRRRIADLPEDVVRSSLSDIHGDAERLARVIDDMLALARLDRGHPPELEPTVLTPIIAQAATHHRERYPERNVHVDAEEHLPLAEASADFVDQILENLLTNAEKYGDPDAPIDISIASGSGEVIVSVTDRGTGITPEDVIRLFEPFYRSSTGHRSGGLGLGLTVCKRLVEAQRGRIWCESRVGGGTTFAFSVPVIASEFGASRP
ncbi:MAG: PAS domain S-box protein [Dehalococcoidia bacterium]